MQSKDQEGDPGIATRLDEILERDRRISVAQTAEGIAEELVAAVRCLAPAAEVAVFLAREDGPETIADSGEGSLRGPDGPLLRALRPAGAACDEAQPGRVVLPLGRGEVVAGALDVRWPGTEDLDAEIVASLRILACCAATALHNLRTRDELQRQRERLQALIDSSADAIITTDARGTLTLFSPGAEEIFGYGAEEVLGTPVAQYYYRGRDEAQRVMERLRATGQVKNHETWFRSKSGRGVPASLSCSWLRDRGGEVVGTLGVLKDITRHKEMEEKLNDTIERLQEANEKLEVLAVTDNLSGLHNHRHFYRELEAEMERAVRTRRCMSLLMIDIDAFKKFNDTYGHQTGDHLIEEIGSIIRNSIRRIDTGCRYGGEEFTVILPETGADEALIVADRIRTGFSRSPAFGDLGVEPATLSVGVAMYDPRSGRVAPSEVVRVADEAMYRAKRQGGNGVSVGMPNASGKERAGRPNDDVLG